MLVQEVNMFMARLSSLQVYVIVEMKEKTNLMLTFYCILLGLKRNQTRLLSLMGPNGHECLDGIVWNIKLSVCYYQNCLSCYYRKINCCHNTKINVGKLTQIRSKLIILIPCYTAKILFSKSGCQLKQPKNPAICFALSLISLCKALVQVPYPKLTLYPNAPILHQKVVLYQPLIVCFTSRCFTLIWELD